MSNLVVISFKDQDLADKVLTDIVEMQNENLLMVDDAAVAIRNADGNVKVKQAHDLVGAGALGGGFWGMLFGLLFFAPLLGLTIGAVGGALIGKGTDYGINDDFIKRVSASVKPGSSALFLLVSNTQVDRVIERLKGIKGKIIHTSLSVNEEKQLKEAFAAV